MTDEKDFARRAEAAAERAEKAAQRAEEEVSKSLTGSGSISHGEIRNAASGGAGAKPGKYDDEV